MKDDQDEIIVVDDGSTDTTTAQIETFGDELVLIKLNKNSGQHYATRKGIEKAQGQFVITIDDDLPILREDILRLKNACTPQSLVYANYKPVDKSKPRIWMSGLVNKFAKRRHHLSGLGSSTRGFDLDYYKSKKKGGEINSYLDHEILAIFSNVKFIEVTASAKTAPTRYTLIKLIRHFIEFIKG